MKRKDINLKIKKEKSKISRLVILAGADYLPVAAALDAQQSNVDFLIYAMSKEVAEEIFVHLQKHLGKDIKQKIKTFHLTKISSLLKMLKADQASHLLMTGKVQKSILLNPFQYDLMTIRLLASLKNRNDDEIFRVLLQTFERNNFRILPQSFFLQNLLLPAGIYSKKKPNKKQWQDIRFGLYYAKEIGKLDIGQTVVVTQKMLLAVETAVEGTDEAILRGGKLARKNIAVVCKSEKKNQDQRFDVPAIGLETLESMEKSGCKILAIEANKTFVPQFDLVKKKIDELKMILVSENVPKSLDDI